MLRKLFYYDMKALSPVLLITHGALLFMSLIYFFINTVLPGDISSNWFLAVYAGLLIIALSCLCIFTEIYPGIRYYKNIYSDEGYLTNTLPVTPGQIILSKVFAGILWEIMDLAILAICILLLIGSPVFELFSGFFDTLNTYHLYPAAFLLGITILFSIFSNLLMVYCSVAVGSYFRGHRVLGSIGGYFVLYFINQIICVIIIFIFFAQSFLLTDNNFVQSSIQTQEVPYLFLFVMIGIEIILGIFYYLFCYYTLEKKLNLD